MAFNEVKEFYTKQNNDFYRDHYHHIIFALITLTFLLLAVVCVVFYQILTRPLPQFNAAQPDGKTMMLIPYDEPNLLPDTILRWASKAATVAYTFNYLSYKTQLQEARPYFTENGWQDYLNSVNKLINSVVQNQLFVNGVVAGTPVIANQGDDLPGKKYAWRIQIPFLVTYQSANTIEKKNYRVVLFVVRVPTNENKQAIGIDQFLMV